VFATIIEANCTFLDPGFQAQASLTPPPPTHNPSLAFVACRCYQEGGPLCFVPDHHRGSSRVHQAVQGPAYWRTRTLSSSYTVLHALR
jgi:hypothetical protein